MVDARMIPSPTLDEALAGATMRMVHGVPCYFVDLATWRAAAIPAGRVLGSLPELAGANLRHIGFRNAHGQVAALATGGYLKDRRKSGGDRRKAR